MNRVSTTGLRVLFCVEGCTDIRFVLGLSRISELTMLVPQAAFRDSGLAERLRAASAEVHVIEVPGGRLAFQLRSALHLWTLAEQFDVILSQELLRVSLNATVIGWLRDVPVVTTMAIPAIEYFRCRRQRGAVSWAGAMLGEAAIRVLLSINGRLSTRCLALGPYLQRVAARYCPRTSMGLYYGVDVDQFAPITVHERAALRNRLELPTDRFLIVFSSRISHEKDPETMLDAVALMRAYGHDAVVLNLGGGYNEFLELARRLHGKDALQWTIGRSAVHPMDGLADYYRAADVVVQSSLEEGLGYSPLEALACGTPVVATAVGGLGEALRGFAHLTPRRDPVAMAEALMAVAADPARAHKRALAGRDHVARVFSRAKAFADLECVLHEVAQGKAEHRSAPVAAS